MVLKNSLCHIWVCIPVRAIGTCGVSLKWIRMKTTLGQMSSYSFQVRAKVHRTISPSVFTHLGRLCQESPEASDLNSHSFFHPKDRAATTPLQGERCIPPAVPSFWAHCSGLYYTFLNGCLERHTKVFHDQGHCVDQWENTVWKCFLPNALFFLSRTQVSQDASKDLTQNGEAGTGYKSLFSVSSSRWLFT